jgi:lipopolysaccharide/colanic/teichoic acid biosynthesis glycosyltransferase
MLDFLLSFLALILLSPVLLTLTLIGAIAMKGNPFFVQKRPGKNEKIFPLLKFRTMTNAKDSSGNLLSDDVRLNKYGRLLRSTSLDELPELINIFIGQMSIVGPRPLLVSYLPYYTEQEHHRHDVRPGLTGWAQINGRNAIDSWEQRFEQDLYYVNNISFTFDLKIILKTVVKTVKRSDIQVGSEIKVGRLDTARSKTDDSNDKEIPKK